MTIAELELTLPNGFHDACLVEIAVNFGTGEALLRMLLDVSDADSDASIRNPATLLLHGLRTFVCDGVNISQGGMRRPLTVSGFEPTSRQFPGFDALSPDLKRKLFGFYVIEWNGFIQIAADEAELSWLQEDEAIRE